MLIETLATLAALGSGATALRYAWRKAAAEDARRRDAIEAERIRWLAAIEIERARAGKAPDAPQQMTYAPHTTYAPHITTSHAPALPTYAETEQLLAPPAVPSFATLLDNGQAVPAAGGLLLGYSDGAPLVGSWNDLYSTAIGGLSGSGKSTTQRYLACQTALGGAKFIIVDHHAHAGDESLAASLSPLRAAFLCDAASDDAATVAALTMAAEIGQRRISGNAERQPVIVWVDEYTALMARSGIAAELGPLIERIAQEYRKVGVYVSLSGQIWRADRAGGTPLRDSLASVIAHRMKSQQARMLVPSDEAKRCERLATGQAILYRTNGETAVISVPNTTTGDVVRVGKLLTDTQPTMSRDVAREVAREAACEATPAASQSVSAQVADVYARFLAGENLRPAIKAVYGVEGGKAYQQASEEVSLYIREQLTR